MSERAETLTLAIDPGRTCGWSLGRGDGLEAAGHQHAGDFLDNLWLWLASGEIDRIAIERFDPRRWDNDAKTTVECVGAIKWIARYAVVELAEVNADAKKKTIDEAANRIANRHARDAEAIRLWDFRYGQW